jgi:DNA helicase II / ATP-dependent DNA helicase PcrA
MPDTGPTPAQARAIEADGNLLITACPGSGKTYTLQKRASHLLRTYPDSTLAALTFTRDAAQSLERKIRSEVPDAGRRVTAGTFHGLCGRQVLAAYGPAKLLDERGQLDLLRRLYEQFGGRSLQVKLEEVIERIQAWKAQIDPLLPLPDADPAVRIYTAYAEALHERGARDFSDMVLLAARGVRDGSMPPLPVTHMLVDEFQDTDDAQLAWVLAHVERGVLVTTVGDDDQSIFSFRGGGGYAAMRQFQRLSGAKIITLDQTFRCAPQIIAPAASLIAHNSERVEKDLRSAAQERGSVSYHGAASRRHELEQLGAAIVQSGDPGSWCILYRTNAQGDEIEAGLGGSFPMHRIGGKSFWELSEPRLLLQVIMSLGAGDLDGFEALLSRCGVSEPNLQALHRMVGARRPGALERFLALDVSRFPRDEHIHRVHGLAGEWVALLQKNERQVPGAIAHLINTHVRRRSNSDGSAKDASRLGGAARSLAEAKGSLLKRVQSILVRLRNRDKECPEGAVTLMTLHRSKGLEFDRVWIAGVEEGQLPSARSEVDEERRLLYVGMTRARVELHLSAVTEGSATVPSRFLSEAGLISATTLASGGHRQAVAA